MEEAKGNPRMEEQARRRRKDRKERLSGWKTTIAKIVIVILAFIGAYYGGIFGYMAGTMASGNFFIGMLTGILIAAVVGMSMAAFLTFLFSNIDKMIS